MWSGWRSRRGGNGERESRQHAEREERAPSETPVRRDGHGDATATASRRRNETKAVYILLTPLRSERRTGLGLTRSLPVAMTAASKSTVQERKQVLI